MMLVRGDPDADFGGAAGINGIAKSARDQ